jgi:hypothetical protein
MQDPDDRPTAQHLAKTLWEAASVLSNAEQTLEDVQGGNATKREAVKTMTDEELEDRLLREENFLMVQDPQGMLMLF